MPATSGVATPPLYRTAPFVARPATTSPENAANETTIPPGAGSAVQTPPVRFSTASPPAQSEEPSKKTALTTEGEPGSGSRLQVPSAARFQRPSPVAAQTDPSATVTEAIVRSESPSNAKAPAESFQTPRLVPAQSVPPSAARARVSAPEGAATGWKRTPARLSGATNAARSERMPARTKGRRRGEGVSVMLIEVSVPSRA